MANMDGADEKVVTMEQDQSGAEVAEWRDASTVIRDGDEPNAVSD